MPSSPHIYQGVEDDRSLRQGWIATTIRPEALCRHGMGGRMRDAIDHALPPLTCTQATNLTLLLSHLPASPPDHPGGRVSWHATGAQIHP